MNKSYILGFLLAFSTSFTFAQKPTSVKSPLDISYLPVNFAHDRKPGEKAIAKVIYSRPSKNDREIFGALVPWGKVWRAGANGSTEIKFYQDVQLADQSLKAGTYSLFVIPNEKEWTVIFNADVDYWGAYSYNEKNDALRINVPVKNSDSVVETFTIQFKPSGKNKANLVMFWDKAIADIPFNY